MPPVRVLHALHARSPAGLTLVELVRLPPTPTPAWLIQKMDGAHELAAAGP